MRKLTLLLALIFTFSFSSTTFAETSSDSDKSLPSDSGKHYKISESHKQITDKDELIKRAIEQRSEGDKNKSFNAKQLLKKRVYDDGTIEEDYVSSSVALMDENQQQIDASAVALTASGYTYEDAILDTSNGIGAVAFIHNMYVTARYTPPYASDLVFKVNQVETKIVNQTSTSYATQIEHGYHIYYDAYDYTNSAVVSGPSLNVSYYVNSIHINYYPWLGGLRNSIFSFYKVTTNAGTSVTGYNVIDGDF